MICAYTQNLFDTFNHSVLFYPVMLLEINTKSNNPCFLILEICLWKSFLQISNKQSTAKFLFLLVQLLQCSSVSSQKQHFGSIFELPVKWLLYLRACPFSSLASIFCFLTCFELIASVAEPSNHVPEILSGDATFVQYYTLFHKLLIAILLLDYHPSFGIFFPIRHHYIILA